MKRRPTPQAPPPNGQPCVNCKMAVLDGEHWVAMQDGTGYVYSHVNDGTCLDALRAEVEAMKPVVEAAEKLWACTLVVDMQDDGTNASVASGALMEFGSVMDVYLAIPKANHR